MEHHFAQANGVRLHYVEEGAGPLVLLLHGFPDFWYGWREQIPVLAAAGFRVVAADLRGYNLSDRPAGISQYRLDVLVDDVAALVRELGGGPPTLVGHDWGGVIAWRLAMRRPASIRSLVVLNAPHPAAFRREMRRLSSQILRSTYAAFFQLPTVPEAVLSAGDFAVLKLALRNGPARDGAELQAYLEALSAPGALTAALNYYRAARRHPPGDPGPIRLPTLLLWGRRDPFLVPELTSGLDPWVEDLQVVHLPRAGHWLQLSHAPRVGREIVGFIRRAHG